MTYRGRVKNGVVVLEGPQTPPDGTQVSVRVLKGRGCKKRGSSQLYKLLKPVIGKAKGFPPDASANLDHYLYGTPRKS